MRLMAKGAVSVEQQGPFGEIELVLKEEALASLDLNLFGDNPGETSHG